MTIDQLFKEMRMLDLEIKSRSGLICRKNPDGSTADLIKCVVESELMPLLISSIEGNVFNDTIIEQYKKEYISLWMTLFHEKIVRKKRFNWN